MRFTHPCAANIHPIVEYRLRTYVIPYLLIAHSTNIFAISFPICERTWTFWYGKKRSQQYLIQIWTWFKIKIIFMATIWNCSACIIHSENLWIVVRWFGAREYDYKCKSLCLPNTNWVKLYSLHEKFYRFKIKHFSSHICYCCASIENAGTKVSIYFMSIFGSSGF